MADNNARQFASLLMVRSSAGTLCGIPSIISATSKDEAEAAALEMINGMCPAANGFTGHKAEAIEITAEGLTDATRDEARE